MIATLQYEDKCHSDASLPVRSNIHTRNARPLFTKQKATSPYILAKSQNYEWLDFSISYRSGIWRVTRWRCCSGLYQIPQRSDPSKNIYVAARQLSDIFARFGGKASYSLVNRGPGRHWQWLVLLVEVLTNGERRLVAITGTTILAPNRPSGAHWNVLEVQFC